MMTPIGSERPALELTRRSTCTTATSGRWTASTSTSMPGEVVGAARRQRRRQVHAAQGDVRARTGPAAAPSGCTARRSSSTRPATPPRAGIQMVYQDLALVEPQDIATNLNIGREILRKGPLGWLGFVDHKAMRRRSEAELDRLGVRTAPMTRPVEMLSGGQRQVVALARSAIRVTGESQRRAAARRADRGARLRADPAGRGADPPDGRPGHRDRRRSPTTCRCATRWPTGSWSSTGAARSPTSRRGHRTDHIVGWITGSRGVDVQRRSPRLRWRLPDGPPPLVRRALPPAGGHRVVRAGCRRPGHSSERFDAFMQSRDAAPAAGGRRATTSRPGPHGPVPVRVYTPAGDGADRPCLVWLHGGAFHGATSTCPRPTGPRARSAPAPARSWSASTTGSRVGGVDLPGPARRRGRRRPLGA